MGSPEQEVMATSVQRRQTLNIRIKPEERGLIDRAAQARGRTAPISSSTPHDAPLRRHCSIAP
jgi:hypothetical protein